MQASENKRDWLGLATQLSTITVGVVTFLTALAAIFYFSVNAVIAQNVNPRLDRLEDNQAVIISRLDLIESQVQILVDRGS